MKLEDHSNTINSSPQGISAIFGMIQQRTTDFLHLIKLMNEEED
jgi:hypothetical protein